MEVHPSTWTNLIGKLLGKEGEALHHFTHHYDHVIAAAIVMLILAAISFLTRSGLSRQPSHFQQVMEVIVQSFNNLLHDNIGKEGKKFLPLVGTLGLFIFTANLMGMVPTFSAAATNLNTTVACAVIVFLYYNYAGVKEHGIGYLKHFLGPVPLIAPLMLPIEIISHIARPFSLAMRLFGNISGEHLVTAVFYGLIPFLIPMPLMAIGLFASFLQAFIFVMLTMVYIAGAIAHDH